MYAYSSYKPLTNSTIDSGSRETDNRLVKALDVLVFVFIFEIYARVIVTDRDSKSLATGKGPIRVP